MKKLIGIVGGVSFILALGIVGAVEHGAAISRLLWLIPLLAVMAGCVGQYEKMEG